MAATPDTDTHDEHATPSRDDAVWLAISNEPAHTVIRGPFTNEEAAVEAIAADYDEFHVEPRIPQDDADESCTTTEIHPTY